MHNIRSDELFKGKEEVSKRKCFLRQRKNGGLGEMTCRNDTILNSMSLKNSKNLGDETGFIDSSNHGGTLQTKQFGLTK